MIFSYCPRLRRARVVSLSAAFLLVTPLAYSADSSTLSLRQALTNAADVHPALQVFRFRQNSLSYEAEAAALRPAFRLGAELENVMGTGEAQAFSGAELTVSLSSIIELGDKRAARIAFANSRVNAVSASRNIAALDLAADVTARYMQVVITNARIEVAREARQLSRQAVSAVRKRVNAGAAPKPELRRARAALAEAEIELNRLLSQRQGERATLAQFWNASEADIGTISGDLFSLDSVADVDSMLQKLAENPNILAFASQERVQQAALRLARSAGRADIEWQAGARRLQGSQDIGFVGGVSIPLNTARRNAAAVSAAESSLALLPVEREAALRSLQIQLRDFYQRRVIGVETLNTLRKKVIPELQTALRETREAYNRGRYSYLERISARNELIAARKALIEAAANAQLAQLEIERLTGESLLAIDTLGGAGYE